jgi:3-hydroxyacyl-CoA dehydrogenase/enoyl-CoA hydratase/3-hydroxybutyryl-CoA epimerase
MTDVLETLTPGPKTEAPKAPDANNWRLEILDDVARLWLDCEGRSTNLISEAVLRELDALLDHVTERSAKALVIRSTKPSGFAAGADIDEFSGLDHATTAEKLRAGHSVLDKLAALSLPTIAVIHGHTLGGGFELALACDYRIGIEGLRTGFPEIRLGLHPGLGGTFRLTALIDPLEAMQIILTGKNVHDRKARRLGIVDALVPQRHVEAAIAAAVDGRLAKARQGLRGTALRTGAARTLAATRMRAEAEARAPRTHYPAPFALIDLWQDHGGDRADMQAAETASFADQLQSATAQNLIRVFYLRRKLKEAGSGEHGIHHVHVIGAGEMGAEIAAWVAIKELQVTLEDVELEPLGKAVKRAADICEKHHLSGIETRDALDRLMPDPDKLGRARADLVIEAVPEKQALKEEIYAELTDVMKPGAILATNTSSLRLAGLMEATPDPGRFAGLHFFNPVSKMQLVEVVSHEMSKSDTLNRLAAFTTALDRLPARVGDHPGFLVNRLLAPYLLEAMVLLDEGRTKKDIDCAALSFGMPMGPLALADQVGLDVCLDVLRSLREGLTRPLADTPGWLENMIENGRTGRKAGSGLYDYDAQEKPPKTPAEEADAELVDRLILPMCDAGVECLRKQVAPDADTIDAAMIFGTGWAPFRGGPMHYARVRGDVATTLRRLAETHGERFNPDPGWNGLG